MFVKCEWLLPGLFDMVAPSNHLCGSGIETINVLYEELLLLIIVSVVMYIGAILLLFIFLYIAYDMSLLS